MEATICCCGLGLRGGRNEGMDENMEATVSGLG